jgi:hypothetical protein
MRIRIRRSPRASAAITKDNNNSDFLLLIFDFQC